MKFCIEIIETVDIYAPNYESQWSSGGRLKTALT